MLCPGFMLTVLQFSSHETPGFALNPKPVISLWCTSAAWVRMRCRWTWEKKTFLRIRISAEPSAVFLLSAYLCNYLDWMSWAILLLSFSLSCGPCINPYSISCITTLNISASSASCHSFFSLHVQDYLWTHWRVQTETPLKNGNRFEVFLYRRKTTFFHFFFLQYFRCIQSHTNILPLCPRVTSQPVITPSPSYLLPCSSQTWRLPCTVVTC